MSIFALTIIQDTNATQVTLKTEAPSILVSRRQFMYVCVMDQMQGETDSHMQSLQRKCVRTIA